MLGHGRKWLGSDGKAAGEDGGARRRLGKMSARDRKRRGWPEAADDARTGLPALSRAFRANDGKRGARVGGVR